MNLQSKLEITPRIDHVMWKLRDNGFQVWIVGGAVRDVLMNKKAHDIDLATNATPEELFTIFGKQIVAEKSQRYGVTNVMQQGEKIEIASLRRDIKHNIELGGRHSDIEFTDSIEEDANRRDFTINTMFWDDEDDKILDPTGLGFNDIKYKILRVVGDTRERFQEDPLRILRAIRFMTLGFRPTGIIKDVLHDKEFCTTMLATISINRIRDEMLRCIDNDVFQAVTIFINSGIMETYMPEFMPMINYEQDTPFHKYSLSMHSIMVAEKIKELGGDPVLQFIGLFHDVGKPSKRTWDERNNVAHYVGHDLAGADMIKIIMTRLNFSNKEINRGEFLVRNHMILHSKHTLKSFMSLADQLDKHYINDKDIIILYLADLWGSRMAISYLKKSFVFPRILVQLPTNKIMEILLVEKGPDYHPSLISNVTDRVRKFYHEYPNISNISILSKTKNYCRSLKNIHCPLCNKPILRKQSVIKIANEYKHVDCLHKDVEIK